MRLRQKIMKAMNPKDMNSPPILFINSCPMHMQSHAYRHLESSSFGSSETLGPSFPPACHHTKCRCKAGSIKLPAKSARM